jgi:oxygen-independent coproporphyrinogen-3 oxidase
LRSRYVAAQVREAELAAPEWLGETFASAFLGGGTPTTLDVEDLQALLSRLRSTVDVASDAEITIEANPDTVDRAKLSALLDAGYTRLSMGAQSFDRTVLESLERLHDTDSVRRAMHAAREAGYANVNVDLIYGANGETLESWERTLRVTVDLQPEHVSAYALTIEQSTPLGRKVQRGVVPAPDADLQADMFELACEVLGEAGFHHYEVSNWAKPGLECRHNLGYWERRPYLGLGAGAHSYRDGRRWWNVRPPEEYLSLVESGRLPVGGKEHLTRQEEDLEEVFLKLRTLEGIPVISVASGVALGFLEQGLLSMVDDHLVPTERGMFLLNELVLGLAS